MTSRAILFFALCILVISTNVIWYRVKFVLESRGYPVSYMRNHFQDFTHLKRLIKAETDPAKRRRYILLQRALYASITFTFCLIITFFAATVRGKSTPQPTQIPATAQP